MLAGVGPDNPVVMAAPPVSRALLQFVEDEMLRAPLLFDQLIEGTLDHARKSLPEMPPLQRSAMADLMQALQSHREHLNEYFVLSLREQVNVELARHAPREAQRPGKAPALALVDEDVVALDVQLSHTIEAIKSVAEYELRELQTFTSALVGDMDVARDHNPFRAETYARALWAAAQALPLSRGHQVAFMRHSATPFALLLRKSYAASSSRLESMGVEPAAYRTLILPAGSRRGRAGEPTLNPDLHGMRETMPAPLDESLAYEGQAPQSPRRETWTEIARHAPNRADRQAIELVSRLFDAMLADERVPADVGLLLSRLHGPSMRLALRDPGLLDQGQHPLWRFVNQFVYAAEMAPDPADPERVQLLKLAQGTIDQLASEPEQTTAIYRWARERLEAFLHQRLKRRLAAAASQIGALQKLEDRLTEGQQTPSTMHGMLDVPQLDTVPAELLEETTPAAPALEQHGEMLARLRPGDWLRMFLQGRWVQAQLLWPGERHEIWLFGDGASDATWAVRRGALLMMMSHGLVKALRQRSIVGTAAGRVQEQVAAQGAAH
jgi:hypothetical protein